MSDLSKGIITEDIAAIGGIAVSTAYAITHRPGFPKPLGLLCGRRVWSARAVEKFFRTRVDGRIESNRRNARKRRAAFLKARRRGA
jgi:hypothetical protein